MSDIILKAYRNWKMEHRRELDCFDMTVQYAGTLQRPTVEPAEGALRDRRLETDQQEKHRVLDLL